MKKPVQGAINGGAKGLAEGLYMGTKGLVLKPVAGVLDGVSKITQGVSNTFDNESTQKVERARVSRVFYGRERIFKIYDETLANLMEYLAKKNPKKYSNLTVLGTVYLNDTTSKKDGEESLCLILTLERIFLINVKNGRLSWKIRSVNMSDVFTSQTEVGVVLKKPTKTHQVSSI